MSLIKISDLPGHLMWIQSLPAPGSVAAERTEVAPGRSRALAQTKASRSGLIGELTTRQLVPE